MKREPRREKGFWCWRARGGGARVCFAGRGPDLDLAVAVRALASPGFEPAWVRQVHSAVVCEAVAGLSGTADALMAPAPSDRRKARSLLALTVVTADCVPVLLAGGAGELAAIHAGWRGIAGGIVPATVERLGSPAGEATAWVGPAIGRCCYEVGAEVAAEVIAGVRVTVPDRVIHVDPAGRPHLDLRAAVEMQLAASGVRRIHQIEHCTRCDPQLWSFRREGHRAGRNLAFILADLPA